MIILYASRAHWRVIVTYALVGALSTRPALPARAQALPSGYQAQQVQPVGYSDLNGRPGFKLSVREYRGRWYLYMGHFWHRGWSIVDVTDPAAPRVVKFVPGPDNTFTGQMELAGNTMVTGLEKILPGFGGDSTKTYQEGVLIWDISDPVNPRQVGHYRTGGTGTHRNFYAGGRYLHLAAGMPGYQGNIYVVVDISDPTKPVEAGRWWVPGQHTADGEQPAEPETSLHGPPYVLDNQAYLSYGAAGMIILDISEVAKPKLVGQLDFSPPFHQKFGVHTVLPIPGRKVAYVNSEDVSYGKGALHHASIVDISRPQQPRLLATLPVPVPPAGTPYRSFEEKGGWSGPHNISMLLHNPDVQPQGNLLFMAHFNAGLRVFNVANSRLPSEVGYFLPPEPTKRYGPMPQGKLALQTEDVLVDRRGFVYITHKNQGLWILRYTGPTP
ncbi:MAG: hypothetical protein H7Z75_10130 [Ferruginibacter sp.]|nr:hypothetical protein [Cytophagales bacterium]